MSKSPATPMIELFTQDEMHAALVRAAVARALPNVDAFLENHEVDSRVAYRNIRMPDGSTTMVASVVIMSSSRSTTDHTPVPPQPNSKPKE